MALELEFKNSNFQSGNYWKLQKNAVIINAEKQILQINVGCFPERAAAQPNEKNPLAIRTAQLTTQAVQVPLTNALTTLAASKDIVKTLYTMVKDDPYFKDATDVLETGQSAK